MRSGKTAVAIALAFSLSYVPPSVYADHHGGADEAKEAATEMKEEVKEAAAEKADEAAGKMEDKAGEAAKKVSEGSH